MGFTIVHGGQTFEQSAALGQALGQMGQVFQNNRRLDQSQQALDMKAANAAKEQQRYDSEIARSDERQGVMDAENTRRYDAGKERQDRIDAENQRRYDLGQDQIAHDKSVAAQFRDLTAPRTASESAMVLQTPAAVAAGLETIFPGLDIEEAFPDSELGLKVGRDYKSVLDSRARALLADPELSPDVAAQLTKELSAQHRLAIHQADASMIQRMAGDVLGRGLQLGDGAEDMLNEISDSVAQGETTPKEAQRVIRQTVNDARREMVRSGLISELSQFLGDPGSGALDEEVAKRARGVESDLEKATTDSQVHDAMIQFKMLNGSPLTSAEVTRYDQILRAKFADELPSASAPVAPRGDSGIEKLTALGPEKVSAFISSIQETSSNEGAMALLRGLNGQLGTSISFDDLAKLQLSNALTGGGTSDPDPVRELPTWDSAFSGSPK